jgi:hypothetical protein
MNDMSSVIVPKSTQQNADDFLAGPRTVKITGVKITPGSEQPCAISFEGDDNKPYFPCKSMARVLVSCWGPDAKAYIGRSLTLYCDPKVTWGGMAVGGIRISHLSDISGTQTMALTATRGNKKPFTVKPLIVSDVAPNVEALRSAATEAAANGTVALKAFWDSIGADDKKLLRDGWSAIKAAAEAVDARQADGERQPGEEG